LRVLHVSVSVPPFLPQRFLLDTLPFVLTRSPIKPMKSSVR
jgi:hypothetical protein